MCSSLLGAESGKGGRREEAVAAVYRVPLLFSNSLHSPKGKLMKMVV